MALRFGISFAPNHPKEVAEWCRVSEDCGFERVGLVDSQSIYRELYVSCTAGLQASKSITIGPRVTNALTRHPTVTASAMATMAELAPGRVFAGIGTGDSALINIGMRPIKLKALGEFVSCLRALMRGERVLYQGSELQLTWSKADLPIYVSAHGPKTLEFSGQHADGIVYGDGVGKEIVEDALSSVASGAVIAGRSIEDVDIWWGLCGNVGNSREEAMTQIKMLLAAKANHLARFPIRINTCRRNFAKSSSEFTKATAISSIRNPARIPPTPAWSLRAAWKATWPGVMRSSELLKIAS